MYLALPLQAQGATSRSPAQDSWVAKSCTWLQQVMLDAFVQRMVQGRGVAKTTMRC